MGGLLVDTYECAVHSLLNTGAVIQYALYSTYEYFVDVSAYKHKNKYKHAIRVM